MSRLFCMKALLLKRLYTDYISIDEGKVSHRQGKGKKVAAEMES